jgi:hypothetical protein
MLDASMEMGRGTRPVDSQPTPATAGSVAKPRDGDTMNDRIDLLDPVEADILRAYFGLRTKLASRDLLLQPPEAGAAPVDDSGEEDDAEAARDRARGVRVRRDLRSPDFPGDAPLSNAVARICINAIQRQLPNWSAVTSEGEFLSERTVERARSASVVALPRLLLEINWADSGPGFSWPEAYYATYFAPFRRHVITASVDCAETWGATDFAIGVVPGREDLVQGCGRVLRAWWRYQRDLGDQPPWAYILSPGLVGRDVAYAWRSRTWARSGYQV